MDAFRWPIKDGINLSSWFHRVLVGSESENCSEKCLLFSWAVIFDFHRTTIATLSLPVSISMKLRNAGEKRQLASRKRAASPTHLNKFHSFAFICRRPGCPSREVTLPTFSQWPVLVAQKLLMHDLRTSLPCAVSAAECVRSDWREDFRPNKDKVYGAKVWKQFKESRFTLAGRGSVQSVSLVSSSMGRSGRFRKRIVSFCSRTFRPMKKWSKDQI